MIKVSKFTYFIILKKKKFLKFALVVVIKLQK